MTSLAPLIIGPTRLFPILLAVIIAARLLNGDIVTRGLLTDRETGRLSALRVQMLIGTLIAVGTYTAAIFKNGGQALPAVQPQLLELVAGTNGLLLSYRAVTRLLKQLNLPT